QAVKFFNSAPITPPQPDPFSPTYLAGAAVFQSSCPQIALHDGYLDGEPGTTWVRHWNAPSSATIQSVNTWFDADPLDHPFCVYYFVRTSGEKTASDQEIPYFQLDPAHRTFKFRAYGINGIFTEPHHTG